MVIIKIIIIFVKNKIMELETLSNIFANIGFPAAVCIALFWQLNKTQGELKKTIDNNTKILQELCAIIKTFIK